MNGDVWVDGRLAATLMRVEAGVEFSYTEDYLERPGRAVATTLPVTRDPVRTFAGALPPFFAGLLPEGRRLSVLRRSIKASADDELALLLAVGTNLVGNIQVVPSGTVPPSLVDVDNSAHIDLDAPNLDLRNVFTEVGNPDAHGLAGIQEKASGRTIAVPIGVGTIVKVSPPEFPRLVENEYSCLKAFASMKWGRGHVVDAKVIEDSRGMRALVVRRFDSNGTVKYPVEDASQLLGRYPADKYEVSWEELTHGVLAVTTTPKLAARSLALQLAFGWLSGNGDIHAKNISVVDYGRGFEVAPAYDLPSTVPYGDMTLALPVMGNREGLSRKRFLAYCESIGLAEKVANDVATQALAATANLGAELVRACAFDARRERDLLRVLRRRRQHW
ncbi:type II toxin-antitoxin system HipA family toxin [Corynebacterium epidermidicanis]|uniref:HipA domain-containing protein n=1 Tax=Corynebacterium epidermidicanis TaxID=1050174 RepID=A0A0G3GSU6_9CORY|nr:HipA domain-containing protein [Corynebacterium epidermidicanis]AKK04251.1 HipA domain-containing protein [Corynebacterium epidermidicanis]